MTLVRLLARPLLASTFVVQGFETLQRPEEAVPKSEAVAEQIRPLLEQYAPGVPTDTRSLVVIDAGVHFVAGLALATGRFPRVASLLLLGTLVPTSLAAHRFWEHDDPEDRATLQSAFLKDLSLAGGLLVAAVDTAGRPGLWWRAGSAARDARRALTTGRRQAALAARAAAGDAARQATPARKATTARRVTIVHRAAPDRRSARSS